MRPLFYLLAFATIILISCEKEVIVEKEIEVEKQFSWKLDSNFSHDIKIQLNSFSDDEKLHTIGLKHFTTVRPTDFDKSIFYYEHALNLSDYPINYRWPISSRIYVGIQDDIVGFHASRDPVFHSGKLFILLKDLDAKFARHYMPKFHHGDALGLNDQLQCLIPYNRYADETQTIISLKPYFVLANLDIYHEDPDLIDTLSCKMFTIDQTSPYTEFLINIHTIDLNFFLTFTDKTYKVSSEGNISEVFEGTLLRLVKVQDIIYGISYDALYKSVDDGNSWVKLSNVARFMSDIHYKVINDEFLVSTTVSYSELILKIMK